MVRREGEREGGRKGGRGGGRGKEGRKEGRKEERGEKEIEGGSLLGSTSLYLFFSSAPGGTSAMVTMFEGMVCVKVGRKQ